MMGNLDVVDEAVSSSTLDDEVHIEFRTIAPMADRRGDLTGAAVWLSPLHLIFLSGDDDPSKSISVEISMTSGGILIRSMGEFQDSLEGDSV